MSSLPRLDARLPEAPGDTDAPRAVPRSAPAISRGWLFAALVAACVAVAGGYAAWAVLRGDAGRAAVSGPVEATGAGSRLALVAGGTGTVLFQNTLSGEHWNRVGAVPLGGAPWPRSLAPLGCMRVHFAADRGLCLAADGGTFSSDEGVLTTHAAYVFGPDFRVQHEVALGGYPSRARVSPDGRYGATTVFVSGHSYSEGGFSTETLLIDLARGKKIANLEEFAVWRDGKRFAAIDFNFWGVTFAQDSNRFYATVATRAQTYLVEGDVAAREMRVLRENLECPSLSPDGTRLAFKKRVGGVLDAVAWRFHVLDLATLTETPLAEARSIDDQIEWLDDNQVIYGDGSDLWTVPADGSGEPRRFMSMASSPAVVRTASLPPPDAAAAPVDTLTLPATDLAVAVSAPPQPIRVGQDLTYTITVTNRGPVEATNVLVEQDLAEGVTYGSAATIDLASGGSWGCSRQTGENRVTCDTLVLPSGESWTIALTVRPTTAGTTAQRVTVYAAEPDAQPENDRATTQTTVTDGP
jgi:uncharacterized repeat protein (TIGR01451 family)